MYSVPKFIRFFQTKTFFIIFFSLAVLSPFRIYADMVTVDFTINLKHFIDDLEQGEARLSVMIDDSNIFVGNSFAVSLNDGNIAYSVFAEGRPTPFDEVTIIAFQSNTHGTSQGNIEIHVDRKTENNAYVLQLLDLQIFYEGVFGLLNPEGNSLVTGRQFGSIVISERRWTAYDQPYYVRFSDFVDPIGPWAQALVYDSTVPAPSSIMLLLSGMLTVLGVKRQGIFSL